MQTSLTRRSMRHGQRPTRILCCRERVLITPGKVVRSLEAGRLAGLRVVLVAAFAALNVAAVLYLFGDWVCEVPPAGPDFTHCRLPAPSGGLSFLDAALLLLPSGLAALLGATVTIRNLRRSSEV